MSYILGNVTLPQPKSFARRFIEKGRENLLIEGKSTKRVENRKEKFVLVFLNLTRAQMNSILSEYELEEVRSFQVTEPYLAISATDVLIDIAGREYVKSGGQYRQNLTLILTEIS